MFKRNIVPLGARDVQSKLRGYKMSLMSTVVFSLILPLLGGEADAVSGSESSSRSQSLVREASGSGLSSRAGDSTVQVIDRIMQEVKEKRGSNRDRMSEEDFEELEDIAKQLTQGLSPDDKLHLIMTLSEEKEFEELEDIAKQLIQDLSPDEKVRFINVLAEVPEAGIPSIVRAQNLSLEMD